MYQLVITLQSALCAADGDGFASVIDTDIVTDTHGIPYIPARRLKGCLHEAAEEFVEREQIDAIFGRRGEKESGSLHIGNAILSDYSSVLAASSHIPAQRVTELFTESIASTAIGEEGSADENSLRFMRAVSARAPWNREKPLVFLADVEIDETLAEQFGRICKALRHIGYKRNRGFGAVSCRLQKAEPAYRRITEQELDAEKRYTLSYVIRLDAPLMLPGKALDETQDFIGGQQVIGVLAAAYLKAYPDAEDFDDLFLNNDVRFSNLYLTDSKCNEYIPVPQYLGKSKEKGDEKKILNMLEKEKYKNKIIKPIKSGYVCQGPDIVKARTEQVYHNAMTDPEKGGLYTQNCLQAGQFMRGTISAPGSQMQILRKLLETAPLRFGQSKTAQYGKCSLAATRIEQDKKTEVQIAAGQYAVYALTSDVILMDNDGNYDVTIEALRKALNITGVIDPFSTLKYTVIRGFLKQTGLQKAHIRALAAGSMIAVKDDAPRSLPAVLYIGEQQNAGFGQVRIFPADELLAGTTNVLTLPTQETAADKEIATFFAAADSDDARTQEAVKFARNHIQDFDTWNPAFLGRVTLMVRQADSRDDLNKRVESIKSDEKRRQAADFLDKVKPDKYTGWEKQRDYLLTILRVVKYRKKGAERREEESA